MNKPELLESIRRERARLDELIAPLDDDDLTTPGVVEQQSIKDLLAHVTAWEQLCLIWMRTGRRIEGPFTDESLNALNAEMFERDRNLTVADVRTRARRSYAEVLESVGAQSDEVLAADPAWAPGRALWEVISSNTDEHYREHADQIDVWLQGQHA
jgi:hypothetical protein